MTPFRRLAELDQPVRYRLQEVSVVHLGGRVSRSSADPAIGGWARLDALLKRLASG
jgi:hypothetical protein